MSGNRGLTRALRHRPFLALWIGHTVSQFGTSLHRLALAWWIIQHTGSGLAMGMVMICGIAPMVPFLLIGGAFVDRFDRVRILLFSDVARGVLSGLIAVLMATDRLELWHVYVIATAFGSFDAFFLPAVSAVIPTIVPKEDRSSANSLRTLTTQLASILGPMVAAVVISIGQSSLAFAIDATTFAVSALAMVPLLGLSLKVERNEAEQTSVLADIRRGFAYVKGEPWLWISIVAFFFINAASIPVFTIALMYVVTQTHHYGASVLGLIEGLAAVGTISASVWVGRRGRISKRGWVLYGWVIAEGAFGIALGLPIPIYGVAVLAALAGSANAVIMLVWTSLMQDRVPEDQFGRVSSIDMMGAVVMIPLGMAVVGASLDRTDSLVVCVIAGGVTVMSGALSLLHPKMREID